MEIMLTIIDRKMMRLLKAIDLQEIIIDKRYADKLRDFEVVELFRNYNNEIKELIDEIDEIEVEAIRNRNESIMFQCEGKKAKLLNTMTRLTYKYDM